MHQQLPLALGLPSLDAMDELDYAILGESVTVAAVGWILFLGHASVKTSTGELSAVDAT